MESLSLFCLICADDVEEEEDEEEEEAGARWSPFPCWSCQICVEALKRATLVDLPADEGPEILPNTLLPALLVSILL